MDNPNITMEEYIKLEEEKARRRGKVYNWPLLPSPKPTVSYFDDLDYFKDFEKEFLAIVYNYAQTSKLDFFTEPTISPQHIDEFNLKDETSLSECDEEEHNILNFNDLFPFNIIYPNDSKSDKDNDDEKVNVEHSSGDLSVKPLPDVINTNVGAYADESNKLLETNCKWECILVVKTYVILLPLQLMVKPKNEGTIEGIIRNYYDREDGETTPRFEE
ncbi:hypothetical protein Tco_1331370 [Tanacetum coccineum]